MIACLDVETTGLSPRSDEILSLSIVDAETGEVLLDQMYRPARRRSWPKAQSIHGISPGDVADRAPIAESVGEIRGVLSEASVVVAYNADFDLSFLDAIGALPEGIPVSDPMLDFATHHARGGRWQRLEVAARRVGHVWTGDAHGSLADARAAAEVWRWLSERGEASTSVRG